MNDEIKPEPKKRLGVMSLTITVKYEDGFESTQKTPDMIGYRPSEMSVLTPNQRPTMVKIVNMDALKKAQQLLKEAVDDVAGTIPSDEDVAKAKREIAAQQAAADRHAGPALSLPGGSPKG